MTKFLLTALAAAAALCPPNSPATRYHGYTEKFGDPEDGAKVLAAGYFGGKGNEWLTAAGFAPDGSIVLVGNVIGPGLEIPGVTFRVFGEDTPPPPEAKQIPQVDSKGRQRTHKDGSLRWESPSWRHDLVTGFVLRCSPDLKTVLSAHRLPWVAGAITDCKVGKDGAIYISGRASELIGFAHGKAEALKPSENGMEKGGCDYAFVAKLKSDASGIEWLKHVKGNSNAPKVSWTKAGALRFTSQDIREFSPEGDLLGSTVRTSCDRSALDGSGSTQHGCGNTASHLCVRSASSSGTNRPKSR